VIDLAARRIRHGLLPLIRYLRSRSPDALQVSMWPLTVLAIIARVLARSQARLVLSDHVLLSRQYGAKRGAGWFFLRKSLSLFYPMADARVAVSKGAAADLASLGGLDPTSIMVIYNPVSQGTRRAKRTSGLVPDWQGARARILTVGQLKAEKNHALLLRAMAELPRDDAKLMILGEGPLYDELQKLAKAIGISDRVIMPGFVLDPTPYYESADLFVLSSDYEGFGLVLVEALLAGLPIVSTDCPTGPREILAGGAYGTLVPCGDSSALAAAIGEALDRPNVAERLIRHGREMSGSDSSGRYLNLMTGQA
jgi:glycosyltransferase involved in cell wall biosynthesis